MRGEHVYTWTTPHASSPFLLPRPAPKLSLHSSDSPSARAEHLARGWRRVTESTLISPCLHIMGGVSGTKEFRGVGGTKGSECVRRWAPAAGREGAVRPHLSIATRFMLTGSHLLLNLHVSSLPSRESSRALSAAGSSSAFENGTHLKDCAVNTCCVSKAKLFVLFVIK